MIEVVGNNKNTILEQIEMSGGSAHNECRKGVCGACVSRLVDGEVEYIRKPLAFYRDDQVVICCAKAIGQVTVETY